MNIPGNLKNIVTKKIIIKENAHEDMSEFIKENFNGAKGLIICDQNTDYIAAGLNYARVTLDINSHHADEFMIEQCDGAVKNIDCDYFIACGAGTIHDIARVIAHKYNKPFISFPTAASVDGFVSGIAPLTTKSGMKITLESVAPVALFADTLILANAPYRLTASGMGDLIGKFIALADWRIANLLLGEEIDGYIIDIVFKAVFDTVYFWYYEAYENKELCAKLLEALVLSGLCMQSMGNSRPASGAEHHIAHFFEMDILGQNNCLHGENVAIGAVLCHELYQRFVNALDIKFIENYALDEDLIKKYYGGLAGDITEENQPAYLHRITPELFYKNLDGIKNIIEETALYQDIPRIVSLLAKDFSCAVSCEIKELALKLAPYVRNRFTLLKLCRCLEF
jgi:glycerol-1-phosphate dehydrogenase [NAD(P)+]